jgi:hypothetical protein
MPLRRLAATSVALLAAVLAACTPSQLEMPEPQSGPGGISEEAWRHALAAHARATEQGRTTSSRLAIIDYSLPSTERRLWIVDLATNQLLMHEYVAHAVNSGGTFAFAFSNRDGSNQSSLGTFITDKPYFGIRGLSLRLRGLERGINHNAWARGIVFHGTPGVSEARARRSAMGRTYGCPAVPITSIQRLVSLISDGVVVFAWFPDRTLLTRSEYLDRSIAWATIAGL